MWPSVRTLLGQFHRKACPSPYRCSSSTNVGGVKLPTATEYLRRINATPNGQPTVDYLSHLLSQHSWHVPYDNALFVKGRLPILDHTVVVPKIVTNKRGGTCGELGLSFWYLLTQLGYDARLILVSAYEGGTWMDLPHIVNVVAIDGKEFVVDAGFGIKNTRCPVPVDGEVVEAFGVRHRIREDSSDTNQPMVLEVQFKDKWLKMSKFSLEKITFDELLAKAHKGDVKKGIEELGKVRILEKAIGDVSVSIMGNLLRYWDKYKKVSKHLDQSEIGLAIKQHFGSHYD